MDGNVSYLFLPFSYRQKDHFLELVDYFDRSECWEMVRDEIHYMFRFVAEKMDSHDREKCQCFHFRLAASCRERNGLAARDDWYLTDAHRQNGIMTQFRFQIRDLDLFCFSTGVCIAVVRIHFAENSPLWISTAQYYLKKVSREPIRPEKEPEISTTILGIAEDIFGECRTLYGTDFFFYANPKTERANILTCLEMEPKEDCTKEMYFLRRCYHDEFLFVEDKKEEQAEIFSTSKDIIWGVSPEAAVCLTMPASAERKEFFDKKFYLNFENQYLYMYVLLLHRKYTLYMFLTRIGIGMHNDIRKLEQYRNELYEFETDFSFSCVTEVYQYKMLYDRLEDAHSLKRLYEDVREPIVSLGEVRREAFEKKEKKRDDRMNYALAILAFLGISSALVDSFDFFGSILGWFFNDRFVKIGQGIVVAIVALISCIAINRLLRKDDDKDQ